MKHPVIIALLLAFSASALHAQSSADQSVGTARALWQQLSGYVTQAAEDMPEANTASSRRRMFAPSAS